MSTLDPSSAVHKGVTWNTQQTIHRKNLVLCFDGTGNKFQGNSSDSNILKIYRMLDREDGGFHYYQPGIGTYVTTKSLSHTSMVARIRSWYIKAKDSAVGTTFDEHVVGAYTFLMRYYQPGDDIYFFGFSRGSYTARFLAEMLDYVGLLSAGNEELIRFAWKTFAQWQERSGDGPEEQKKKKAMFEFMRGFRETFSRPVRRIRFLGLFDTVNSVPRFENAWMRRSKFPYTARSSAKVIRHAVAIDERRAKFRQDLISETIMSNTKNQPQRQLHQVEKEKIVEQGERLAAINGNRNSNDQNWESRFRRASQAQPLSELERSSRYRPTNQRERARSRQLDRNKSISPRMSSENHTDHDFASVKTASSRMSSELPARPPGEDDDSDEENIQDVEELWFPGGHADIGGGWPLADGEESPLSHCPLVWMVREARKAGLEFDYDKMKAMKCCDDDYDIFSSPDAVPKDRKPTFSIPQFQITPSSPGIEESRDVGNVSRDMSPNHDAPPKAEQPLAPRQPSSFMEELHNAAIKGHLHDCLQFKNGLPTGSVIQWKLMEYLPFRRMDLQPDGSWKSISWPLPKGEVRDIPEQAWIHHSAIKRMQHDENYRPGNLIIGGGGRGMRRAPKELGMGRWQVLKERGDPVGETMIREGPSIDATT